MSFKNKIIILFSIFVTIITVQSFFIFAEEDALEQIPIPELYEDESQALNNVDVMILGEEGNNSNETGENLDKNVSADSEKTALNKILDNPIYLIVAIIISMIVLSILWKLAKFAFKIGLAIAIVFFLLWIIRNIAS